MKEQMTFVNAQKMHRMHPETFNAPDLEDLREFLQPGDLVKVCVDNRERFWTRVISVSDDIVDAEVANNLIAVDLHFGDSVRFALSDVYSWMRAEDAVFSE